MREHTRADERASETRSDGEYQPHEYMQGGDNLAEPTLPTGAALSRVEGIRVKPTDEGDRVDVRLDPRRVRKRERNREENRRMG